MSTETIDLPKVDDTGTDNPDDMGHYISKKQMTDAAVFGFKVKALCGYEFIPTKEPKGYPCPKCKEIFDRLPK